MSSRETDTSALLRAATPELYRRNAFRLTGLPVTVTAREIARQADKLKMLAEVDGHAAQQLTILDGAEPPSHDDVREAVQRLKNVESRAIDEFFWFWPEDWERPDGDEAIRALSNNDLDGAYSLWLERHAEESSVVASHNLAVLYHMRALEWAHVDLTSRLTADDKGAERNL